MKETPDDDADEDDDYEEDAHERRSVLALGILLRLRAARVEGQGRPVVERNHAFAMREGA